MCNSTDEPDRVRRHTAGEVNRRIDAETDAMLQRYAGAGKDELSRRIDELEREWDIERVLETNASSIVLLGLVLSRTHHRNWLWLPAGVAAFLLQHALQGWCPPVPVLRRLGVRTQSEIDREKYMLKALRGDFEIFLKPH
ncbi:MAG: YgaP family membrane protein [Methylobacter sp.]